MRNDFPGALAVRRRQYTGEPHPIARRAVIEDQQALPAAGTRDQLLLEASVAFQLLALPARLVPTFPFGIRSTSPRPHTLHLMVESKEQGQELLQLLLPCDEPGSDLRGIAGVRVRRITPVGMELHQPGRATSLWLTGLRKAQWHRAVSATASNARSWGQQPLWRSDQWSARERDWDRESWSGAWGAHLEAGAWLSSGLLRRLPLLHTISAASTVSAYRALPTDELRWHVELDHPIGVPWLTESLVQALTDPRFGLPVTAPAHAHDSKREVELQDLHGTGALLLRHTSSATSVALPQERRRRREAVPPGA
jgi:hypothetical protein